MTDRYNALFVVLEHDIRDDDAQPLIDAFKMMKGVLDVTPHVMDPMDAIATTRAKQQMMEQIIRNLKEDSKR